MNKREYAMNQSEVQGLLEFRRRGYFVKSKKGKGSYDRKNRQDYELERDYFDDYDDYEY